MFKEPFSFEGRIRRSEYGLTIIIYAVLATIIDIIIEDSDGDAAIIGLAFIPMLWILWAQGAKRCHDLGNSGWWQLIPFYGLWLIFQDGQPGSNQYGENPKGIQVLGGQSYQGYTNTSGPGNNTTNMNTGSGYQGGYSGGHNNPATNYNEPRQESQRDGYRDGDLYN